MADRRRQHDWAKAFRGPIVGAFKMVPRPVAKWLFGLFRWSDSILGYGIRYLCIHRLAKSCGDKVVIGPGNFIYFPERLELGTNVYINEFCHIQAAGGIKIGDGALIAHQCTLMSGDHRFDIPGKMIFESETVNSPIVIGDDVWLGAAVRVMQGITIGTGSIVGAGAIVTRDVPPGQIAVGMPAKVIRARFPDESAQQALDQADASRSQSSNTINA